MKIRLFSGLFATIALTLIAGCTEIPQQSIEDAKKALDAAKKAEAQRYAPAQMEAALVSYELAKKELTEESRKLPFFRKYTKIIETLRSARSAAESALAATETTKTSLSSETQGLLASAQAIADSADTLIAIAANKKNATDTLSSDLDSVNAKIRDAGAILGSGDLFAAKNAAEKVLNLAQTLAARADSLVQPKKSSLKKKPVLQ